MSKSIENCIECVLNSRAPKCIFVVVTCETNNLKCQCLSKLSFTTQMSDDGVAGKMFIVSNLSSIFTRVPQFWLQYFWRSTTTFFPSDFTERYLLTRCLSWLSQPRFRTLVQRSITKWIGAASILCNHFLGCFAPLGG